jgi:hypothetical protein
MSPTAFTKHAGSDPNPARRNRRDAASLRMGQNGDLSRICARTMRTTEHDRNLSFGRPIMADPSPQ